MSRVEPDEDDYAYWLAEAQKQPRSFGEKVLRLGLWGVAAIIVGIAAIVALVVLLAVLA